MLKRYENDIRPNVIYDKKYYLRKLSEKKRREYDQKNDYKYFLYEDVKYSVICY